MVGYFTLQGVLWAWKRWVEKGEVYRGKRRRMAKRVSGVSLGARPGSVLCSVLSAG